MIPTLYPNHPNKPVCTMISDIIDERSLGALFLLSGGGPEAAPRELANNRAIVVRFNAQESELFDDYRLRKPGTRSSPILLYFFTFILLPWPVEGALCPPRMLLGRSLSVVEVRSPPVSSCMPS